MRAVNQGFAAALARYFRAAPDFEWALTGGIARYPAEALPWRFDPSAVDGIGRGEREHQRVGRDIMRRRERNIAAEYHRRRGRRIQDPLFFGENTRSGTANDLHAICRLGGSEQCRLWIARKFGGEKQQYAISMAELRPLHRGGNCPMRKVFGGA